MRSGDAVSVQSQLGAFLAGYDSAMHSADVGPLIGYAAWLLECRAVEEPLPAGWREVVNAALSDSATTGGLFGLHSAAAGAAPPEMQPVPLGIATMRGAGVPFVAH